MFQLTTKIQRHTRKSFIDKMEEILIDDSFIDSDLINHRGQKYPRILIQNDEIVKPALAPEHLCRDIFVERTDQNLFIRLLRHYRTKGFICMLKFIKQLYHEHHRQSNPKSDDNQSGYPTNVTNYGLLLSYIFALVILQIHSIYLAIHLYFYPFDKYSDDDLLNEFNLNPEWKSGLVRTFVWHPNSLRCALALVNDLIYVYSADHKRPMNHITCVKNVHQRRISSMCWHPKLDDVLVVACRDKILIWRFECLSTNVAQSSPALVKAESSSTRQQPSLQIVNTHLQSPITSLAFNMNGNMLVSCSPRNASLSLCRFDDKCQLIKIESIRMKQLSSLIHLPQLTSLQWSPDGQRLLALTTVRHKPICVFESIKWSYKFWTFPCEHNQQLCQTAVWSRPNGMILLFVPKQSSKVYALTFYDQAEADDVGGCSSDKCTLVLDTRQFFDQNDITFMPIIRQMCWDSKSTKLVVSFHDPLKAIAIFNTNLNPGLNIRPFRILKPAFTSGLSVRCLLMNFHDNYIDPGCLITICWSNGIVTHVPLEADSNKNDRSLNESIRSLTSLCTSFDESSFVRPAGDFSLNRCSISSSLQPNGNGLIQSPQPDGCKNLRQSEKTKSFCTSSSSTPFRRSVLYSTRVHYD